MKLLRLESHGETANISRIGVGTIGAGIRETATYTSIKTRIRSLEAAYDFGVNFFDAGESYENGFSEEILGKFARHKRDRLIIGSKFSPENASCERIPMALEGSLRRLKTDYIDLYQMHWLSPNVPLEETMGALEKLQEQGKVRFIGLGNCTIAKVREANSYFSKTSIATNQIKVNLYKSPTLIEKTYFDESRELSLINIAYGVLGQGRLRFSVKSENILGVLRKKYNISNSQILIAWVMTFPNTIALTRSMNHDHLRSNIAADNITLEMADINLLNETFKNKVENIHVQDIQISNYDVDISHKIYLNLEAALANEFNLTPDVAAIAQEITESSIFEPIELVKRDNWYSLVQGRMRFWAWIYLHGDDCTIPSVVIAEEPN